MFKDSLPGSGLIAAAAGLGMLLSGFMLALLLILQEAPTSLTSIFILFLLAMALTGILLVSLYEAYAGILSETVSKFSSILFGENLLKSGVNVEFLVGPPVKAFLNFSTLPLLAGLALASLLGFEEPVWVIILFLSLIFSSTIIFLKLSPAVEGCLEFLGKLSVGKTALNLFRVLETGALKSFQRLLLAKVGLTAALVGILILKLYGLQPAPLTVLSLSYLGSASLLAQIMFKVGVKLPEPRILDENVEGRVEKPEGEGENKQSTAEEKPNKSEGKGEEGEEKGEDREREEVKGGEIVEKVEKEEEKPSLKEEDRVRRAELPPATLKSKVGEEAMRKDLEELLRLADELRMEVQRLRARSGLH
ncbi:MAG: hypothetical protein ACXQTV_01605 [Candidatus Hecatellaceae archaeon]